MREQFLQAIERGRPPIPSSLSCSSGGRTVPALEYLDEALFAKEQLLFRAAYQPVALQSELDGSRPVFSFEHSGRPYFITKGPDGKLHGFINSCVHRGTRLLDKGFHACKKVVTCPYHNWTYDLDGAIHNIPHKYGFPNSLPGLAPIALEEKAGILWASPGRGGVGHVHPMISRPPEIDLFRNSKFTDWSVYKRTAMTIDANWKLIVESALEFYHFKATHRDTIYPAFFDNIGLVEELSPNVGPGLKVTLPSKRIGTTTQHTEAYSHILYYFFPGTFVLVEDNLFNVMRLDAAGIGQTHIEMLHVVPAAKAHLKRVWDRRIDFTLRTLDEDYQRTKRIQQTLAADPQRSFFHGSYEYGLGMFHDILNRALDK